MNETCHCGHPSMSLDEFMRRDWSSALRDYCMTCAVEDCDANPDACAASKPWLDAQHWGAEALERRVHGG